MSGGLLLGVVSPVGVVDLFLHESAEIHSRVELICLCSWIRNEAFCIQTLRDLRLDSLYGGRTFMIWAELMPRNLAPCFCSSTVVSGRGFLQSKTFSKVGTICFEVL